MRLRKNVQRFYFEQRLIYHTIEKYFLRRILYELSGRSVCFLNSNMSFENHETSPRFPRGTINVCILCTCIRICLYQILHIYRKKGTKTGRQAV